MFQAKLHIVSFLRSIGGRRRKQEQKCSCKDMRVRVGDQGKCMDKREKIWKLEF